MKRRTKIAATLGPASDSSSTLRALLNAGLEVARLNFSHGTHDEHRERAARFRAASRRGSSALPALMADLQGPRFRVGELAGGRVELLAGSTVQLVAGARRADRGRIPVSYARLAQDVARGNRVLLDDGKLELRVLGVRGDTVRCEVVRGGELTDRKGINLPGTDLSAPALTAKDRRDLVLAVELDADWLAVSFVRRARDVALARRQLERAGSDMPVMAKIERPEAVDNLDEILDAADGLLVARGDLGVELPPQRVPILQKQIIHAANRAGKPVVTATQMLDSMRLQARPTRAEASDVANAVLDGSGCLLLTAETAVGAYPVEAVRMMATIIEHTESELPVPRVPPPPGRLDVPQATCLAGCRAAEEVGARYLIVFTQSGFSAQQVARFRPPIPILAFTPDESVCRRLQLRWGVSPRLLRLSPSIEELVRSVDRALLRERLAERDDVVVVLSGSPLGHAGTTNLMHVHRVGRRLRAPQNE